MASARTDESSRLTRTLIVAFAVAATAGLIAGPAFAFLSSARAFPGPGMPMQERFGIAVSGLHSAFWLLLLAVVLSRLQAQPRWLDVWLAGLAVTVTAYGLSEIAFVWVPNWMRSPEDSTFFMTAYAGVYIVRSAAMVGVSAVVAWSMIRWVRRPVGDADADADAGDTDEVVVAELVDGSDG